MFDNRIIGENLHGLVGYRQPANPKYANLEPDNLESQSGLMITDNPYAKIEYLRDTQDYSRISAAAFNEYLRTIRKTSALNVCNQVFDKPDFITRDLIYINAINKVAENEFRLPDGFVGYKIKLDAKKNVAFRINRAMLEFVKAGTLELLVFNSNLLEPLYRETIDYDAYYNIEDLNWICNDSGYYKGDFYIGYIANGISTYKRNFENSSIQNKLTYLDISQVKVETATSQLFDQSKVQGLEDYCGFNLDITIVDDFTDLILNNKYLFSRAIYLNAIIACLNVYAASLRSNGNERDAKELYALIMLEIEGTRPDDNVVHVRGLRPEMLFEISQIRDELLKLKTGFLSIGYNVDTQD